MPSALKRRRICSTVTRSRGGGPNAVPLELALREHLADYLAGAVTLDEFKDWLVGATWDVDECGDSTAIELAYEIKLALAEHSGGHATDEELRAALRDQLHRGTIVVSSASR
jgi:hypothetical protein